MLLVQSPFPNDSLFAAEQVTPPKLSEVRCKERLGGLLRHYYRKAG